MESISRGSSSNGVTLSSILSIVAGVLILLSVLFALSIMSIWVHTGMPGFFGMGSGGGMMMGGWWGRGMMWSSSSSFIGGAVGAISAVSVALGAILIIGGYSIHKNPERANRWGIAILVSSIVGFLFGIGGGGGFFIGPILGIIGGILALVKK